MLLPYFMKDFPYARIKERKDWNRNVMLRATNLREPGRHSKQEQCSNTGVNLLISLFGLIDKRVHGS